MVFCSILLALLPAFGLSNTFEVERVAIEEMEQDNVLRIANYLGSEQSGRRVWVRTQEDSFDGLYYRFFFESSLKSMPRGAILELELLLDQNPEPITFTLPLPDYRPNGREIWVGLTGTDWELGVNQVLPTAWKLIIRSSAGEVLVEKRSFIWGTR